MSHQRHHSRNTLKDEEHGQLVLDVIKKRAKYHTDVYEKVLSELTSECTRLKKEIDNMCAKMEFQLQRSYDDENKRLQEMQEDICAALKGHQPGSTALRETIQRVKAGLKTKISYEFKKPVIPPSFSEYAVKVHMSIAPDMWVPADVQAIVLPSGDVKVSWHLEEPQQKALLTTKMTSVVQYRVELRMLPSSSSSSSAPSSPSSSLSSSSSATAAAATTATAELSASVPGISLVVHGCSCVIPRASMFSGTRYRVRVRMEHKTVTSEWSPSTTVRVPDFARSCTWQQCPESVDQSRRYALSGLPGTPPTPQLQLTSDVATKVGDFCHSTVIGKASLPHQGVTTYTIRIVNSRDGDGRDMWVGIAPYTIDQNVGNANVEHCGWYFNCYNGCLSSGPPHCFNHRNYAGTILGAKFKEGKLVKNRSKVIVTFDSAAGTLAFACKGRQFGTAFEGVPLDVPVVPVVLLYYKGDSVEISLS